MGYDLDEATARVLSRRQESMLDTAEPADPDLLREEQDLLELFADITELSRREPDDPEDEHSRSDQEYFFTYLAFLDPERSGVPDQFLTQLRRALARYGVMSTDRTPELEQALLRMYRSLGRLRTVAPAIMSILDRWRQHREQLAAAMTDERLSILDRLIASAHGRQQEVGDLAAEVRFDYVDAPLIKQAHDQVYAADGRLPRRACRGALRWAARRADRPACLVPAAHAGGAAGPLPRRGRGDQGTAARGARAPVLPDPGPDQPPVRNLRPVPDVPGELPRRRQRLQQPLPRRPGGHRRRRRRCRCPSGQHVRARLRNCPHSLANCGLIFARSPRTSRLSWMSNPGGPARGSPADAMAAEIAGLLAQADFGRPLHRFDITVTSESADGEHAQEHLRTQHFSFTGSETGFSEELLYRNLHPMIAERLNLWRLSNFKLERLPSAEDIYLFHAVAHENAKDERLIALAEVRDLTPARDAAGNIIGYPVLESQLKQSLADIRHALGRPAAEAAAP